MKRFKQSSKVQVEVNGQRCQLPTGSTLEQLIQQMTLAGFPLKIAQNNGAVPRSQCAHQLLQQGDKITIFRS